MALVSDALVRRLADWGIHRIFGYSGDGIDPILGALRRAGGDPEFVAARHEESAAFMAATPSTPAASDADGVGRSAGDSEALEFEIEAGKTRIRPPTRSCRTSPLSA